MVLDTEVLTYDKLCVLGYVHSVRSMAEIMAETQDWLNWNASLDFLLNQHYVDPDIQPDGYLARGSLLVAKPWLDSHEGHPSALSIQNFGLAAPLRHHYLLMHEIRLEALSK